MPSAMQPGLWQPLLEGTRKLPEQPVGRAQSVGFRHQTQKRPKRYSTTLSDEEGGQYVT